MPISSKVNSPSEPNVAVIIPCHNHGHLVTKAIQSVAEQDYPKKMISVVNDGSTDDSLEVLKSIMDIEQSYIDEETTDEVIVGKTEGIPMILVNRLVARKQAAARNTAIRLAWQNADLFCQLDADDLYLPGKLSRSIEVYLEDPNYIGLVYCDVLIHNTQEDTYTREYRKPYDRNLLERENIISNAPLMSKQALGYSGLYDEDLPPCEDWDLWLRITENFVAVHIPEELQVYSVTGDNCTFTVSEERWSEQRMKVYAKLRHRKKLRHG